MQMEVFQFQLRNPGKAQVGAQWRGGEVSETLETKDSEIAKFKRLTRNDETTLAFAQWVRIGPIWNVVGPEGFFNR